MKTIAGGLYGRPIPSKVEVVDCGNCKSDPNGEPPGIVAESDGACDIALVLNQMVVLKTVEGESFTLSELRGKVVVLDFWTNWCGPCRKLEPLFDQLAHEYQSRSVKFFTLSIWPDQDFNPQAYLKDARWDPLF